MANSDRITPGSGSFLDDSGNTWTLSSAGDVTKNGTAVPGGNGTKAMQYYNSTVYAQDGSGTDQWYTWDGANFNGPVTAPPDPSTTTTPVASSIQAFLDTCGVVCQGEIPGTPSYHNATASLTALNYLGIYHIRLPPQINSTDGYQAMLYSLADGGAKFHLLSHYTTVANFTTNFNGVKSLVQARPGSVISIEGPNELNSSSWFVDYPAGSGHQPYQTAHDYQVALYNAVKGDSVTSSLKVITCTLNASISGTSTFISNMGDLTPYCDWCAAHIYPQEQLDSWGSSPSTGTTWSYAGLGPTQWAMAPTKPRVVTETGWATDAPASAGVDDATQAKLALNLYIDNYAHNMPLSVIYTLFEGDGMKYGLFRTDQTAKPAATALHNFTTILKKVGLQGFSTAANISISSLPSDSFYQVLSGSTGLAVVIWRTAYKWNPSSSSGVTPSSITLTVNLGIKWGTVELYDPLVGTATTKTASSVSTIDVPVTDHSVVLLLSSPVKTPKIVAPLVGTVTTTSFTAADYAVPGVTLPSGKPFHYEIMMPSQYSTNFLWPLMIWLHPNQSGNAWYGGSASTISVNDAAPQYQNVAFQRAYPCICIVPYADQTTGTAELQNWGGWINTGGTGNGTTFNGETGPNVFALNGLVQHLIATLSIDPSRIYVNGFSLGGHGAEYAMLRYNQVNGNPKIYTAGTSTGGVLEIHGYGAGPTDADVTNSAQVPVWWISGQNDGTSVPSHWNALMWQKQAGNTSYPGEGLSEASSKAGASNYHFSYPAGVGHSPTNNSGVYMQSTPTVLNWLFAQTGAVTAGTGAFVVKNGQIIGPDGKVWVGAGINIRDDQMSAAITNAACEPLTTLFPGINFIRLYYEGGTNPFKTDVFEPMVSRATAAGIVVVIENHNGISKPPYTGTLLTSEGTWYASLATTYKNNPYVWFGTFNEPGVGNGTDLAAICTQEVNTYNAIRNTGNTDALVFMEEPSGGNPTLVGQMTPASSYSTMRNIVWDLHHYAWIVNKIAGSYTTDKTKLNNVLLGATTGTNSPYGIAGCHLISSADGVVPVFIGEFGNSTDGVTVDSNGQELCQSVGDAAGVSTSGFAAWAWNPNPPPADVLTSNNNAVTTPYGSLIASLIKTATSGTVVPPSFTPSPNNTVVLAGSSALITDSTGNTYGIVGAQVSINGTTDTTTANVVELAYVNSVVWHKNTSGNWYSRTSGGWSSATTTSPIPDVSASGSTITAPTTSVLVDSNFNKWGISGGASTGGRSYTDQPGTNACVWNTPLGDGAVWGIASDADTQSARVGGFINSTNNYGAVVWTSTSASDPLIRFTGTGADYDNGTNGTKYDVTAHCVPGSYASGPFPGDNQYAFIDTITYPGIYYHFAPLAIQSIAAGQGPYNAYFGGADDAMSDTFATDWETKHANFVQAAGLIRAYDLDTTKNLARVPGTTLTAIQHVLRYAHAPSSLKANANPANSDYPNGPLLPNSWPQYYQDFQSDSTPSNKYTGNLIYGTLLGIPSTVAMPTTLSNAGKQIWWTLQHYGAITRDASSGGFHLYADQNVSQAWIDQANNDLGTIVGYLCPLRNQHQGGQSFSTNPMNGPGTRLDVGPPALAPVDVTTTTPTTTSTTGGVVTENGTTVTTPGGAVVLTPTSGGSVTDSAGHVWTLTSAGDVMEDGKTAAGGNGTGSITVYNGTLYASDAASGKWYTWNGSAFVAAASDPPTAAGPAVKQMAYVSGLIWEKDANNNWYSTDTVSPITWVGPTTTSPLNTNGGGLFYLKPMKQAGLRVITYIKQQSPASFTTGLTSLRNEQAANKDIFAYEGCQEPDTAVLTGTPETLADASSFQQTVKTAGQSDGLPVIQTSFGVAANYGTTGNLSAYATYGNAHTYTGTLNCSPNDGPSPGFIQTMTDKALLTSPGLSVIHSEFGWKADHNSTTAIASYVLDFIMSGFFDGNLPYYIVNGLYDDSTGQWGLFNADQTPRLVATALTNFFTLLKDSASNALSFGPGKLNIAISNLPPGTNTNMGGKFGVLQKANGEFWVLVRNEQTLTTSDANNHTAITVAAISCTMTLGTLATSIAVYDPLTGTTAVQTGSNTSSITFNLPAHPILIRIVRP
jgi:hypothetical protein